MSEKQLPDDVEVCLVDLPPAIGGAVRTYDDGFTRIYINAGHGHDAQLRDMEHELSHIDHDDMHSGIDIDIVEQRAEKHPSMREQTLEGIPNLKKARDLMPTPPPKPAALKPPILTRRQQVVLRNALTELDALRLNDEYYY